LDLISVAELPLRTSHAERLRFAPAHQFGSPGQTATIPKKKAAPSYLPLMTLITPGKMRTTNTAVPIEK
jgi:hypothetical protein